MHNIPGTKHNVSFVTINQTISLPEMENILIVTASLEIYIKMVARARKLSNVKVC